MLGVDVFVRKIAYSSGDSEPVARYICCNGLIATIVFPFSRENHEKFRKQIEENTSV